jgi:hypothetical protein
MHGIVNKAIQGLVVENFGEDAWSKIKIKSGVSESVFISNQSYDDEITYKLAIAASEVLPLTLEQVLFAFGEYWILNTGVQHYGSLMKAGGKDLKEFLLNLPNFHSRVMLFYPDITPPEFKIKDQSGDMVVKYYSTRPGLMDFMHGLISGLAKMYNETVQISVLEKKTDNQTHDTFLITWNTE